MDLTEEAKIESDALLASLTLCEAHADAFKAPLAWSFEDNRSDNRSDNRLSADRSSVDNQPQQETPTPRTTLSLAHSADLQEADLQEADLQEETDLEEASQSAIPLVRAEDMEDTPLLQRAFRSISG